jgi:predicted dehydrogenase
MIIGTGFGQSHLEWLSQCPGAKVEIIGYEREEKRAREAADRFGVPEVTRDPLSVIASGRVDAVAVASPPNTHEPLASAGLAAGLLVVSDKPLADGVVGARRLVEAAAKAPGRAYVTFQWRVNPALRRLHRLSAEGALGKILRLDLEFVHDFLAEPTTRWPWRHRRAAAGAGALGDQGVHLFDLLRWLSPGEWCVTGGRAAAAWPRRGAEGSTIVCETEDLAWVDLARAHGPTTASVFVSRVATGCRRLRVDVQGTEGMASVSADPDTGECALTAFPKGGLPTRWQFGPTPMNPYRAILAGQNGASPPECAAGFADGLAAQLLLDEALERGCDKLEFLFAE